MRTFASPLLLTLAAATLAACTVMPTGPDVMVLPGTGKSFDQFRVDDAGCRQYAFGQVGGVSTAQASTQSAVGSTAVGTALGAAAGAALNGGSGAAVGAGAGLLAGAAVGAGNAQYAGHGVQHRYDMAYVQCMYARGHRVPIYGHMVAAPQMGRLLPPPPQTPPSSAK
ncbi:Glycine-zipper-containing OmpA-like membrane domain containing protein [Burkholderia multivorans]